MSCKGHPFESVYEPLFCPQCNAILTFGESRYGCTGCGCSSWLDEKPLTVEEQLQKLLDQLDRIDQLTTEACGEWISVDPLYVPWRIKLLREIRDIAREHLQP